MSNPQISTWLIVVGLAAIIAQIIVSIVTALKAKKPDDGINAAGLGELLATVIKGLVTTIPLGALGLVLISVGLVVGGQFSIGDLFPAGDPTPTPTPTV